MDDNQKDYDDGEEDEKPIVKLDFEKLFKMAEDPDLEEIMKGPIECAVETMQNGKEIQKLTTIRTFPDLLKTEGNEALQKLLPAIQKCLKAEKSNLDIHCEAAVVYKSVLQDDELVRKFPGITELLLENIMENIHNQREHHTGGEKVVIKVSSGQLHSLSAAAWLETIIEVADRIPLPSVKQFIVPVVQQQADPVQKAQRRIIAAKLIRKLADILPPNEVRKELCHTAVMLCKDANASVRIAIGQRLNILVDALKSPHDAVTSILPCYGQLFLDDDPGVREAAMNNISECIGIFTKESKRKTIFAMIKKVTERSLEKRDESLVPVARNFGMWMFTIHDHLDQLDKSWILNSYCKFIQISEERGEKGLPIVARGLLKRACAFNFPCMLQLFKNNPDRLISFIEQFCNDHDDDVKMSIASAYHEILAIFPDTSKIIPPFIELLRGGSSEVVAKVTLKMGTILPKLYKTVKESRTGTTSSQLDHILMGCNTILRNTGAWRSHKSLIESLKVLPSCISEHQIIIGFVPLLKKEILIVRAIPCRIAAVEVLLSIVKELGNLKLKDDVVRFFNEEVAIHRNCYRRMLFIDVSEKVLEVFSKKFFTDHFLESMLKLTEDPVSNIRIRALQFLPRIKQRLHLPEDDETLLKVEKSVKNVFTDQKVSDLTRQILNSSAVELTRCESCTSLNCEDKQKEKAEESMWKKSHEGSPQKSRIPIRKQEESEEEEDDFKPSGLRPPTVVRQTSPWRTERRAVAVVRPQPVVTVRSQSPSPLLSRSASPVPTGRSSRLPTAVDRERERLRKAATETPPLPASSRSTRASSVTSNAKTNDVMSTSMSALESSSAGSYGLRRSATSSTAFGGSSYSSTSSYALMSSRSTSNLRRPTSLLSHVMVQNRYQKNPSLVSLKVRTAPST